MNLYAIINYAYQAVSCNREGGSLSLHVFFDAFMFSIVASDILKYELLEK